MGGGICSARQFYLTSTLSLSMIVTYRFIPA